MDLRQTNPKENQTTALAFLCIYDTGVRPLFYRVHPDWLAPAATMHFLDVQTADRRPFMCNTSYPCWNTSHSPFRTSTALAPSCRTAASRQIKPPTQPFGPWRHCMDHRLDTSCATIADGTKHMAWTTSGPVDHPRRRGAPQTIPLSVLWICVQLTCQPEKAHGHTQLRTHFTTVASHAVGGLPQCSHCLEAFTSWRNFQFHLERNCCQAVDTTRHFALTLQSRMATDKEYPKLTPATLTLLMTKPYGPTALTCVQERNWGAPQQMSAAMADWTHHCVLCGVFCNRPQDLNLHMRTQHPTLLPHVMSKASQLGRAQASNSPCRFCNKTFRRVHQCPVMVQAALLLVNTDSTGQSYQCPGGSVLRCDVCAKQFQEIQQLHSHLHQQHRLEPLDWDPLRDMLAGSEPVCSHCLAIFAEKSALRQHITLGQCQSFNPARQCWMAGAPPLWGYCPTSTGTTEAFELDIALPILPDILSENGRSLLTPSNSP